MTIPVAAAPRGPAGRAELQHELGCLLQERDALLLAVGRAEVWSEQATAAVETARAIHVAAVQAAKEAAHEAAAARAALARHDAAIAEVRRELAGRPL